MAGVEPKSLVTHFKFPYTIAPRSSFVGNSKQFILLSSSFLRAVPRGEFLPHFFFLTEIQEGFRAPGFADSQI